jgi:hypothetical protein
MSRIVDFYRGNFKHPRGVTIDAIWKWSPQQLETEHTYIQWLFPLPEPSQAVPGSPILGREDIELFKADDDLQQRFWKSMGLMLGFYGFMPQNRGTGVHDNRITLSADFDRAARGWITFRNHNYLRISRILRSAMLLGFEAEARELFAQLQRIYVRHAETIGRETYEYWKRAVGGE